jgi:hypothetical protein
MSINYPWCVDVHEQRGPLVACAVARRLAARRGAVLVLAFSFVTFLLCRQKKSKSEKTFVLFALDLLHRYDGIPGLVVLVSQFNSLNTRPE